MITATAAPATFFTAVEATPTSLSSRLDRKPPRLRRSILAGAAVAAAKRASKTRESVVRIMDY